MNWSSTRFWIRHSVMSLRLMLSQLFSGDEGTGTSALDVFLLVLVRDRDVLSSGLEVDRDGLTKAVVFGGESVVEDVRDVIVPTGSRQSAKRFSGTTCAIPTNSIHVRDRNTSASTLSISTSVIFFLRTILYRAVIK